MYPDNDTATPVVRKQKYRGVVFLYSKKFSLYYVFYEVESFECIPVLDAQKPGCTEARAKKPPKPK